MDLTEFLFVRGYYKHLDSGNIINGLNEYSSRGKKLFKHIKTESYLNNSTIWRNMTNDEITIFLLVKED